MRYVIIFVVFFLSFTKTFSQKDRYSTEVNSFLNFIRSEALKVDSLTLFITADTRLLSNCEWIIHDTSFLTKSQRDTIYRQIESPIIKDWTNEFLVQTKFTSWEVIVPMLRNKKQGWEYIRKTVSARIFSFSAPIFIRDFTMCLFSWDEYCGGGCADGQIHLYMKENDKWVIKKSYCEWSAD